MDSIALWFASTLGQYVSKEVVIFIISMIPILELRGGLLVAWSLGVPILKAIPICIIGNIIPIPFILLFIRKIFQWMKKLPFFANLPAPPPPGQFSSAGPHHPKKTFSNKNPPCGVNCINNMNRGY